MNATRLNVTCRPARREDTPDVLELTSTIWEGHDYVPQVWEEWLADPEGRLIVAEHDGRVLGLSKLSRLSPRDWWLEGLRVHPQFEGRGIASQLHDTSLQAWRELGCGTLRLGTASFRLPIHHMCARSGFEKVGERAPFYAPAAASRLSSNDFQPLTPGQVGEAVKFASGSPSQELTAGLMDLSWHFAPPNEEYLTKAVVRGQAWWWKGREALLSVHIDEDDELGEAPTIELLACRLASIPPILNAFRELAGSLGYAQAAWMVPLLPEVVSTLEVEGYQRMWENALYLFAKAHPDRPMDTDCNT